MKHEVNRDPLTNLYMRYYGENKINALLNSNDFKKGLFILIDLDDYKKVNDYLGHKIGDELLITYGLLFQQIFDDNAIICRLSGDEFFIFYNTVDFDKAKSKLEKLRKAMIRSFNAHDETFFISGSIGVVEVLDKNTSFMMLYSNAVKALSICKAKGRNTISYYKNYLDKESQDLLNFKQKFENAIRENHIIPYFQPVIRSLSGKVCGMEAIARWHDPMKGLISPSEFIPFLESNRLIHKLDLHIIKEVCKIIKEALDHKHNIVPISINLSRYDFLECNIFKEIEKLVSYYNIPRYMLNIELTESTLMENPNLIKNTIYKFRNAGYQIWMDDFGSAYSSLNVLQEYDFDEIKLDMGFLTHFNDDSKHILSSIITMAKKLGIRTLAEGVETKEQYDFLKKCGCEKLQGFYFGKPEPISSLLLKYDNDDSLIERRGWDNYYNEIGKIDFLTDRALSLINYDGVNFSFIFSSESFIEGLNYVGTASVNDLDEVINGEKSPIHFKLLHFITTLSYDMYQTLEFLYNGYIIHLKAKNVIAHDNNIVIKCYFSIGQ